MLSKTERALRAALNWPHAVYALFESAIEHKEIKGKGVQELRDAVASSSRAAREATEELNRESFNGR